MLRKYRMVKKNIFEYIQAIVTEVRDRFAACLAFYQCEPAMIDEFILWICELSYLYVNGHYYDEVIPTEGA
ncbi:MAG: hypothetical protein ACYC3W_11800 [Candidatus Nanopelagicales bacterium]